MSIKLRKKKYFICAAKIRGPCLDLGGNPHRDPKFAGKTSMSKWDDFKTLIRSQFYPVEYAKD